MDLSNINEVQSIERNWVSRHVFVNHFPNKDFILNFNKITWCKENPKIFYDFFYGCLIDWNKLDQLAKEETFKSSQVGACFSV